MYVYACHVCYDVFIMCGMFASMDSLCITLHSYLLCGENTSDCRFTTYQHQM